MRKARTDEHARRAEAELISVLSLADRFETELAIAKYTQRMLRGRLTRAVELLAGLVLGTFASRARVLNDLDQLKPGLTVEALGVNLLPVLTQLEDEFAKLRQRESALKERIAGLARLASEQFEQFLRAAQVGRLVTAMVAAPGDDAICGEDSDDQR